jgi:electron transport complex protein RnfD
VSEIALLLGLAFMLFRKIITWHIPVAVIGSITVFMGILFAGSMFQNYQATGVVDMQSLMESARLYNPLIHLTSGGLIFGAVFMATDYTTSPMSKKGMIIYGIGIGIITGLIRLYGGYPEGISFAILIMNGLTPMINMYVKPKLFGGK